MHGPKRKTLGALRCSGPPCARGSAYRCLPRFGPAFGHAILSRNFWNCRPVADGADLVGVARTHWTSVDFPPCRWLVLHRGSSNGGPMRRPAAGLEGIPDSSPGRRVPQGPGVSVPDFCKGVPAIPRRRQEGRIYAARPAEAFFLLDRPRPVLFLPLCKKRMGGGMDQPSSWLNPPGGRLPPLRRLRKKAPLWGRGEKKRRPAFRPAASRSAVTPKIPSGCGPPPPPR